jgi:hypothetical protein
MFSGLRHLINHMSNHRPLRWRKLFIYTICLVVLTGSGWIVAHRKTVLPTTLPLANGVTGRIYTAKIYIAREGIYEISPAKLRDIGFPVNGIDPLCFHLYLRGQEQPLFVVQQDSTFLLRFFARSSDSIYTSENIYWLKLETEAGKLTKLLSLQDEINTSIKGNVQNSFLAVTLLEENLLYFPQVSEGDHWFWNTVSIGQKIDYDAELVQTTPGVGRVRMALWGSTESSANPDHHLVVRINGQVIIDETWDGIGRRILEGYIPENLVVDGKNKIQIETPGDTEAAAENNVIDWIELIYPHLSVAVGNYLEFTGMGNPLSLTGFSSEICIYDVTNPELAQNVVTLPINKDGIVFDASTDHRYIAVGSKGYLEPENLVLDVTEPDLRAFGTGAEYIAIAPEDLLTPLEPLINWRATEGHKVLSVPVEAIYDQFGYGFPEPDAIHAFLTYAYDSWNPRPEYVLLVGDATYDPRGYISDAAYNKLPTFFVMTEYGGQTASDVEFALIDGDLLPDLAIGRIPARDAEQVKVIVEKTIAFEQSASSDDWHERILAIADGQDVSFKGEAQRFLNTVSGQYQTQLYSPTAGVKDGNATIRDYFEEGFFWVSYFGHGSVNMWGKDRLFTIDDVSQLSGDKLSVVLNMTCLSGLFTHPKALSLSEAFLWQPNGGAVAVLAPTSLTLPYDQSFLSQPIAVSLANRSPANLGEILLTAQRQVPEENTGANDVMRTFLLFGDPGLRLFTTPP